MPRNSVVNLRFSEPLDPATVNTTNITISHGAATISYLAASNTIALTITGQSLDAAVTITASNIRDLAGNSLAAPFTLTYRTSSDTTPPEVISVTPGPNSSAVTPNSLIVFTFSEALDASTITQSCFTLSHGTGTVQLASANSVRIFVSGQTTGNAVTVTLGNGIRDLNGTLMSAPFVLNYSLAPDNTNPTIIATNPASNGTAEANSVITLTASEPLSVSTLTSSNITVSHGTASIAWTPVNNTIRLTMSGQTSGSTVTVTLGTSVRDANNRPLLAPYVLTYTTTPDVTAPRITTTLPTQGATGVPRMQGAMFTFSEPMDPATINSTNLTATAGWSVYYDAAQRAASVISNQGGWPNESSVTVTVTTGVRDVAGNALAQPYVLTFTTADQIAPTVTSITPQNNAVDVLPTATVRAVFSENLAPATVNATNFVLDGIPATVTWDQSTRTVTMTPNSAMPTGTVTARILTGVTDVAGNALASDYVWTFSVSPVDTTRPTITGITPFIYDRNVALNAVLRVTFSETMDPSSIISSNFFASVPFTLSYDSSTRVATLTPTSTLPQLTRITWGVTTGVRDLAGNTLAATANYEFTTKDPGPPHVVSTVPTNGTTNFPRNDGVDITFNETVQPSTFAAGITCDGVTLSFFNFDPVIRLRNAAGFWPNGATITCHVTPALKDLDGTSATPYDFSFTTPDTVGPQVVSRNPAASATNVLVNSPIRVTFDEAVDVTTLNSSSFFIANRTGTLTWDAATKTATLTDSQPFAYSTQYFVRITPSLRDLVGNGATNSSVSFTTEADTYPPVIGSTIPANGATNVLQALGRVRINFNEAMNPATINASNITCTKKVGSASPVAQPGTVQWAAGGNAAIFTPDTPFEYLALYSCTVSTGVIDTANNALQAAYTFSFTVEADTYPPKISSSNPGRYGHFFPVASPLTVTFDEAVQASTVIAANVRVNSVTSAVSYNATTRTATLTPSSALANDTTYTLTVSGVRDTAGRAIVTPITIDFRTTPTTQRISSTTLPQYSSTRVVEMTNGTLHLTVVSNGTNEYRLQWAYLSNATGTWTNGALGTCNFSPDLLTAAWGSNQAGVSWETAPATRVFSNFDGVNWSARTSLPDENGTVMAGGNVLGLLRPVSGGGAQVQFFDGATWSATTQLSTQGSPNSLAFNGTEWLAVWRYATGTIGDWFVRASAFDGTTWSSPVNIITFRRPSTSAPKTSIATNPNSFAVSFSDGPDGYAAVRYNGAWQPAVSTGFTGGGRNDWIQLASNGSGYAWVYTVGSSVWDLHYRMWDGATQTWSAQPTQNIGFTAYLGRGKSMTLTSSGSDYFVVQEMLTSGVRLHRWNAGTWTTNTLTTSAVALAGPVIGANGRAALTWNIGSEWWSAIYDGAWGAAARVDSGSAGALGQLAFTKGGSTLRAFFVDDDQLKLRTSVSGTTFAAPTAIANTGLSGGAMNPQIALADDGRGLAVWEQFEAGAIRVFARAFNGTTWTGAPFRVSRAGRAPKVATNGTRWVLTWRENGIDGMRASWTQAGGLTTPVKFNATATYGVIEALTVSSGGTFLSLWNENNNAYAAFSLDGVTWEATQNVSSSASAPYSLVAIPGGYAMSAVYLSSSTQTRERSIASGAAFGSQTTRDGICTLATMETTYGGVCRAWIGSGGVSGFVNTQPLTVLNANHSGTALVVGGEGDRLRAVWGTNARDFDPLFDWQAPMTLPAVLTALSDDSVRFFGLRNGAGNTGLEVVEESSTVRVIDSSAFTLETPVMARGRGEVGVVWERADEIWSVVF